MNYSQKLKDPRWQKKRLEIFQRDGFQCQACGNTEQTLAVHHHKYFGQPWECPDEFLETVCEDCHKVLGPVFHLSRTAFPELNLPARRAMEILRVATEEFAAMNGGDIDAAIASCDESNWWKYELCLWKFLSEERDNQNVEAVRG